MTTPSTIRGIRNHNPGNIEIGAPWEGLMPRELMTPIQAAETRFAVFTDATWGIRAIAVVLMTYHDKRKANDGSRIDTIREVIERWAPASENDVDAYVRRMRNVTGLNGGDVLDFKNYDTMRALVIGIITHEIGHQPYPDSVIDKGLVMAGFHPPAGQPSRTIAAGRIAAVATVAGAAVDAVADHAEEITGSLRGILPYLPDAGYLIAAVALVAIGRMVWARIDDRRRGINP